MGDGISVRRVSPIAQVQVLFLFFGFVVAAFFPFISLFLDDRGLSKADIGFVLAAMAVARIGANPVWGHLADTRLGRRRTLQIGCVGAAVAALGLFFANGLVVVTAVACVFAVFQTTTGPNIDAIALTQLGDERMGEYGRVRAWESVSYAIACFLLGLLLEGAGVRWAMPAFALASVGVVLWAGSMERDRPEHVGGEHGRLGTVGTLFRTVPRFWVFLIALLLLWTGFNAAWNFIALKIEAAGGGPLLVGLGTALGGFVEVPTMRLSPRFQRRFGLRKVFVAGCIVYATGFLLWGLVSSPTVVSALTMFEGVGFALLFTTTVVVIGRMVPPALYSTGQSVAMTAGFGLGPILGAGLGGPVYEWFGPVVLYSAASVLTLCGGVVAWFALRDGRFAGRAAADADPGAPPLGTVPVGAPEP
jgi:MFS transporter, PPP family, 3-phenylpropionic acid transporter